MVEPFRSVIVTMVLLKEATMWAMPVWTFLLPFALMILMGSTTALGSSERFSSFLGSAGAPAAASFLAPLGALTLAAFGAASAVAVAAAGAAGAASAAGAGAAGAAGVSAAGA